MISDAYVMVTCDRCGDDEEIQLQVVYSSISGNDPHCDLRDYAIESLLIQRGYSVEDGKHYCAECDQEHENAAKDLMAKIAAQAGEVKDDA